MTKDLNRPFAERTYIRVNEHMDKTLLPIRERQVKARIEVPQYSMLGRVQEDGDTHTCWVGGSKIG